MAEQRRESSTSLATRATFYGFQTAFNLRSFAILITTFYYIYIDLSSNITDNWKSTRDIGLSESNVCSNINYNYFVEDVHVATTTQRPIAFRGDNINDNAAKMCFTRSVYFNCIPSFLAIPDETFDKFNDKFDSTPRSYFPNSVFIIILGVGSLAISVFYDNGNYVNEQGDFAVRMDKLYMSRVNYVIILCIIILLASTIGSFVTIYDENCEDIYNPESDTDDFCSIIGSCGSSISSVIYPNDPLVDYYNDLTTFLAIFLSIGYVLRLVAQCIEPYGRPTLDPTNRPINIRARNLVVPQVVNSAEERQRIMNSWVLLSAEKINSIENECSICLSSIRSKKAVDHHSLTGDELDYRANGSNRNKKKSGTANSQANTTNRNRVQGGSYSSITPDEKQEDEEEAPGEVDEQKEVVEVPCKHVFHKSCITEWLSSDHSTCPVCRKSLDINGVDEANNNV